MRRLKENLSLAEVSSMVKLGDINGTAVSILGLEEVDMKMTSSTPRDEFGQQLLPLVEDLLYEKCLSLLRLLEPNLDYTLPRSILHTHIQRLGDKVADLKADLEVSQEEMDQCVQEKKKIYEQLHSLLGQIVDILETIVTKFYCGSIASTTATDVRNLSVEVECLLMYTLSKTLEIEVATYTGDAVLALRKIRNKLTAKIKDLEKENIELRSRLEQYEKCGPELSAIVAEFSKVQNETEVKKWALEELSQKRS